MRLLIASDPPAAISPIVGGVPVEVDNDDGLVDDDVRELVDATELAAEMT